MAVVYVAPGLPPDKVMKDKPDKPATRFRHKVSLIIFGLFLFLVLLEAGLRFSGFFLLFLQEYRNRYSLAKNGEYRILCLGESTTRSGYPVFLEKILNERKSGIKFTVIDKGICGTNTAYILAQLENNLNRYKPHMVIAMMGINDSGEHLPAKPSSDGAGSFLAELKIYQLAGFLRMHILAKASEMSLSLVDQAYIEAGWFYRDHGDLGKAEAIFKKAVELNPKNDKAYIGLAWCYRVAEKYAEAEGVLKKAIELNPKNDKAYVGFMRLYYHSGKDRVKVEGAFKKAIRLNPHNDRAYAVLGWFYTDMGDYFKAEYMLRKAISINPQNEEALVGLGRLYRGQGRLGPAEDVFKKAIALKPRYASAYLGLGRVYRDQGNFIRAEDMFKKAVELDPCDSEPHNGLGWLYIDHGKYAQAEEPFKRAVELNSQNDRVYVGLALVYREQGKYAQAEEAYKRALMLPAASDRVYAGLSLLYDETGRSGIHPEYSKKKDDFYMPVTRHNYLKLKKILDKRKIRLVCMQYPMRSCAALRKVFEGQDTGIIFIDNENIFKEALKTGKSGEYFADMFAGDFGHCTEKGNKLLAEHIADIISAEGFNN